MLEIHSRYMLLIQYKYKSKLKNKKFTINTFFSIANVK